MIGHLYRVAKHALRERKKRIARSPKWRSVEKNFLLVNQQCASCGGRYRLAVHHKKPFHLFPELELDPDNLIALCMGTSECHLRIGHGHDFKAYVEKVAELANQTRVDPLSRPVVEQEAKAARKY